MARVKRVRRRGENLLLELYIGRLSKGLRKGGSLSVNGACLTVVKLRSKTASFEVVGETLQRTNLGSVKEGELLNAERSLRLSDRLEGHIVLGHVDGIGRVARREDYEGSSKIWVSPSDEVMKMIIRKGSVSLDGVSLTVVDVMGDSFSVVLVPHTLKVTTLGMKREGSSVNIEVDVIGKWVRKVMEEMRGN